MNKRSRSRQGNNDFTCLADHLTMNMQLNPDLEEILAKARAIYFGTSRSPIRKSKQQQQQRQGDHQGTEAETQEQEQRIHRRSPHPSSFRATFNRGDLPVYMVHNRTHQTIGWDVDVRDLDYFHYLPMFFEGIRETEHPYNIFACQGLHDLLQHGGYKIPPVVPLLVHPIHDALDTRDHRVVRNGIIALQHLLISDSRVGEVLTPYYTKILPPVINALKEQNCNLGDGIEWGQRRGENMGDLVGELLEALEVHGGEDAFLNIKLAVPTYQSCFVVV